MWKFVKRKRRKEDKRNRGGVINTEARLLFLIDLKKSVQFGRKKAPEPLNVETEQAK